MSWPTSSRWAPAIAAGATYVFECDVIRDGVVTLHDLPIIAGAGEIDETGTARRRCTFTVAVVDDITPPSSATDALAPYGNEIQVRAGVRYSDGTVELVPVARVRIDAAEVVDTGGEITVRCSGADRAAVVEEERFEEPWVVAPSTDVGVELLRIVERTFPGVESSISGTGGKATPATAIVLAEQGRPWSEGIKVIARDFSLEAFFDGEGRFIVRPVSTPADSPGVSYVEGASCTVISATNRLDAASFNKVIVETAAADGTAPVRGAASDDDPSSPTYYGGRFGKRSRWYKSPFLTTQAQVDSAAATILAQELGGTELLTFTAVPDHSRDAGDVAQFTRERLGLNDNVVISAITLPFDPTQPMTVTTRKRRL